MSIELVRQSCVTAGKELAKNHIHIYTAVALGALIGVTTGLNYDKFFSKKTFSLSPFGSIASTLVEAAVTFISLITLYHYEVDPAKAATTRVAQDASICILSMIVLRVATRFFYLLLVPKIFNWGYLKNPIIWSACKYGNNELAEKICLQGLQDKNTKFTTPLAAKIIENISTRKKIYQTAFDDEAIRRHFKSRFESLDWEFKIALLIAMFKNHQSVSVLFDPMEAKPRAQLIKAVWQELSENNLFPKLVHLLFRYEIDLQLQKKALELCLTSDALIQDYLTFFQIYKDPELTKKAYRKYLNQSDDIAPEHLKVAISLKDPQISKEAWDKSLKTLTLEKMEIIASYGDIALIERALNTACTHPTDLFTKCAQLVCNADSNEFLNLLQRFLADKPFYVDLAGTYFKLGDQTLTRRMLPKAIEEKCWLGDYLKEISKLNEPELYEAALIQSISSPKLQASMLKFYSEFGDDSMLQRATDQLLVNGVTSRLALEEVLNLGNDAITAKVIAHIVNNIKVDFYGSTSNFDDLLFLFEGTLSLGIFNYCMKVLNLLPKDQFKSALSKTCACKNKGLAKKIMSQVINEGKLKIEHLQLLEQLGDLALLKQAFVKLYQKQEDFESLVEIAKRSKSDGLVVELFDLAIEKFKKDDVKKTFLLLKAFAIRSKAAVIHVVTKTQTTWIVYDKSPFFIECSIIHLAIENKMPELLTWALLQAPQLGQIDRIVTNMFYFYPIPQPEYQTTASLALDAGRKYALIAYIGGVDIDSADLNWRGWLTDFKKIKQAYLEYNQNHYDLLGLSAEEKVNTSHSIGAQKRIEELCSLGFITEQNKQSRFERIATAFDVLRDPKKAKRYKLALEWEDRHLNMGPGTFFGIPSTDSERFTAEYIESAYAKFREVHDPSIGGSPRVYAKIEEYKKHLLNLVTSIRSNNPQTSVEDAKKALEIKDNQPLTHEAVLFHYREVLKKSHTDKKGSGDGNRIRLAQRSRDVLYAEIARRLLAISNQAELTRSLIEKQYQSACTSRPGEKNQLEKAKDTLLKLLTAKEAEAKARETLKLSSGDLLTQNVINAAYANCKRAQTTRGIPSQEEPIDKLLKSLQDARNLLLNLVE